MTKAVYPCGVTLTRNNRDEVVLEIRDENSSTNIIRVTMTPAQLGLIVTGLSEVQCQMQVTDLENTGKHRVRERRSVECPLVDHYRTEVLQQWLIENCQEPGWTLNTYLGGKNSVVHKDGKTILNYSVTKYVDTI